MDGTSVQIKHPVTQELTYFFAPLDNSGFLRQGGPTGPRLPAFSSRGDTDRGVPLNSILVNFVAMVRLRRLVRQDPQWGSELDAKAVSILKAAVQLHKAVIWDPESHPNSIRAPLPIQVPGSDKVYDLGDWPFTPIQSGTLQPGDTLQPGPSSPDAHPGTEPTRVPSMAWDEALDLMEPGSFFYRAYLITYSLIGFLLSFFIKILRTSLIWMMMTMIATTGTILTYLLPWGL